MKNQTKDPGRCGAHICPNPLGIFISVIALFSLCSGLPRAAAGTALPLHLTPVPEMVTIGQDRTISLPIQVYSRYGIPPVTVSSSNPELVPQANLVLQSLEYDHTLLITPLPGRTGTAIIRIQAGSDDGEWPLAPDWKEILLTVTPGSPASIPHRVHGDTPFAIRSADGTLLMGNRETLAQGSRDWIRLNPDNPIPIPLIYQIDSTPLIVADPENGATGTFTLETNDTLRRVGDGAIRRLAFGNNSYVGITDSRVSDILTSARIKVNPLGGR
jgi:hypothetical protein